MRIVQFAAAYPATPYRNTLSRANGLLKQGKTTIGECTDGLARFTVELQARQGLLAFSPSPAGSGGNPACGVGAERPDEGICGPKQAAQPSPAPAGHLLPRGEGISTTAFFDR